MTLSLTFTAVMLGFRHGLDWDHIAAIADITSSAENRRRGLFLSLLYACGHAAVVFALGYTAIFFGKTIPQSFDIWVRLLAGSSLFALGVWVIVGLAKHGSEFRFRSRWMLVISGTVAGWQRVKTAMSSRRLLVGHKHSHDHIDARSLAPDEYDESHGRTHPAWESEPIAGERARNELVDRREARISATVAIPRHDLIEKRDLSATYGVRTAVGVGMLHGVGVESPTQIAVFAAAASLGGSAEGITLLLVWVVGLIAANSVLALGASLGLLEADRNFKLYATAAVAAALGSVLVGVLLIMGRV